MRSALVLLTLIGVEALTPSVRTQGGPAHTLYFAEGATGFFTTTIALVNPSATETATATLTFVGESGPVATRALTLVPGGRQTISLNDALGAVGGVATIVESNVELAGRAARVRS